MDKNMHHVTLHKEKKPIYKKVWFWVLIVLVLIGIGGASTQNKTQTNTNEPAKQESAAWDMEAAYAKVTNGMTKAEVEQAVGKKPVNCTENQNEYIGKTEACTYGNAFIDKGAIVVTYSQDKVSSKTKSTY